MSNAFMHVHHKRICREALFCSNTAWIRCKAHVSTRFHAPIACPLLAALPVRLAALIHGHACLTPTCPQFFISPLISPDGISRERQAVDSEHSKNLQSDVWRRQQLWHTAADPSHPYSRFFTGNMDTLGKTPESKGIDVHAALLKFYNAEYSANRMKLCVLGRQSLQELEAMVVNLFSDVPNKGERHSAVRGRQHALWPRNTALAPFWPCLS